MSIGLVQQSGNQCHDRPCAMIGQVPVQLETYISPVVGKVRLAEQHMFTKTKVRSVYILLSESQAPEGRSSPLDRCDDACGTSTLSVQDMWPGGGRRVVKQSLQGKPM